jgi:GTP pyrophosphokinase/guanosine-3',5'-bis(diphosphate) 3'-pyrophosphohydrolase
VGRELVPLSTQLETGQSVEIITSTSAHPNAAWLNFVTTAKARTNIRHYLKQLRNDEAVLLGKRMLLKHLRAFSVTLDDIPQERIQHVLDELEVQKLDTLLEDIGLGDRAALLIARKLASDDEEQDVAASQPLMIAGTEGMVVSFARCCRPIPGDTIHGFISSGKGIVVHQTSCKTTLNLRSQSEKWLDVIWAPEIKREFPVEVLIRAKNQRGALATIASAVSSSDSNIDNVAVEEREGGYTDLRLTIEVLDRVHLARVIRRIKRLEMVVRISRIK